MSDDNFCPPDPSIGDAIIAGMGAGDTPGERMVEILKALKRAGFCIIPLPQYEAQARAAGIRPAPPSEGKP